MRRTSTPHSSLLTFVGIIRPNGHLLQRRRHMHISRYRQTRLTPAPPLDFSLPKVYSNFNFIKAVKRIGW